jgi:hypothetical protein
MEKDSSTVVRFAVLTLVAVVIAWGLLFFWMTSASEPWSNDPWLENTAFAVALAGPVALLILASLLWRRRKS